MLQIRRPNIHSILNDEVVRRLGSTLDAVVGLQVEISGVGWSTVSCGLSMKMEVVYSRLVMPYSTRVPGLQFSLSYCASFARG
jgi:hypothetical protein